MGVSEVSRTLTIVLIEAHHAIDWSLHWQTVVGRLRIQIATVTLCFESLG